MNPNYNELARVRYEYVPSWQIRQAQFLSKCWKLCPNCGNVLRMDAHGCDNCFLQFDKSYTGIRRNDEQ